MTRIRQIALAALVALVSSAPAMAVKIADITRLSGTQNNVIMGVGLVYGLRGTGDGGDYLPAMRPLQAMLSKYLENTTLEELNKTNNVALVTVTARLPSNGARKGDRLDAKVMSMGAASSLRGGQLVFTNLLGGPGSPTYANAEGALTLEDPSSPTVALLKQGVIVERDFIQPVVRHGDRFTLVVEETAASWGLASEIAKTINGETYGGDKELAIARDPRTVDVMIPEAERAKPDLFISTVLGLQIQRMQQEARVVINTKTSTIIVTGDVEISPVVISYKGLTITTVLPKPIPTPRAPVISSQQSVPVETGDRGGAKLQDLVTALEQLKVPADDRINILKTLHESGKLHAKMMIDGVAP